MKIGSLDNSVPLPTVAGDRKAGTPAGATATATPASSATVELSSEATALASAAGDGSFDAEKVDRIGKSIANGTFKVNPEAIADKLIANAQELLARTYR
jgi:negative regulator of flagellin synthesis FlgM